MTMYRSDFVGIDFDASGRISLEEWQRAGFSEEMFKRYDGDGDGSISQEEFVAGREDESDMEAVVWELRQLFGTTNVAA